MADVLYTNTAYRLRWKLVSDADGITPRTSDDGVSGTPTYSINGDGDFLTTGMGAIVESGVTDKFGRWYSDLNLATAGAGIGDIIECRFIDATVADAIPLNGLIYCVAYDPTQPKVDVAAINGSTTAAANLRSLYVDHVISGEVTGPTPTATAFNTDLVEISVDAFRDQFLVFTSGNNKNNRGGRVGAFAGSGSNGTITLTDSTGVVQSPAIGDKFVVFGLFN